MFLDGSETFISAILASWVKIRALNYGADPVILTSGLYYPYIDHFLIFKKKENLTKIFSNWSNFQNFPEMNVSERVLITVKLKKNMKNKKVTPDFLAGGRGKVNFPPAPMDSELVL